MFSKYIFILFSFLFFFCTLSAKPVINWYEHNLPPFYIASGNYANEGSMDSAVYFLKKQMPEFEHKTYFVALRRIAELAKSDDFFATFVLFKTPERESFLLYTEPYAIRFLTHLVILKENLPKFKSYINSDGKIDFEKVITDRNIKLSLTSNRFYSKPVNSKLTKYPNQKNIEYVFSQDATSINIEKLRLQRVDCIVEYPSTVTYELAAAKLNTECIYIPIKDVPEYEYMYITFPKTEYGSSMVNTVNLKLEKIRMKDSYLNALSKWEADKNYYKSVYKKAMIDYFKTDEETI